MTRRLLMAATVLELLLFGCAPPSDSTKRSYSPSVGDYVTLRQGGHDEVWAAVTEDALNDLTDYCRASDEAGVRRMTASGRCLVLERDAEARVGGLGLTSANVKVLSGRHRGRQVVVPVDYLIPLRK